MSAAVNSIWECECRITHTNPFKSDKMCVCVCMYVHVYVYMHAYLCTLLTFKAFVGQNKRKLPETTQRGAFKF